MGSRKSSMRSNKSRSDLDLSPDGLDQPDEGVKKLNENRKLILEQKLGGGKLKKWENIDQVIIIPPPPHILFSNINPHFLFSPNNPPPQKKFLSSHPPHTLTSYPPPFLYTFSSHHLTPSQTLPLTSPPSPHFIFLHQSCTQPPPNITPHPLISL